MSDIERRESNATSWEVIGGTLGTDDVSDYRYHNLVGDNRAFYWIESTFIALENASQLWTGSFGSSTQIKFSPICQTLSCGLAKK